MIGRFHLKIALLLISSILYLPNGLAQVAYHNFSNNDGLPSNEVYSGFQDSDGFLWFATDHGAVKYNGYNFKTYTTAEGLTDNTVLEIKGDEDNKVWALTLSGGLCYFDGKKFVAHPNNDTIKKLLSTAMPNSWEILHNNQTWFAFADIGFFKIEEHSSEELSKVTSKNVNDSVNLYIISLGSSKIIYTNLYNRRMQVVKSKEITGFHTFSVETTIMSSHKLNFTLLPLANGGYMLGQWHRLSYINKNNKITSYNWPLNVHILRSSHTGDGRIWIASQNRPAYALDFKNDSIQFIDSLTFSTSTTSILFDHQGNYWVTTLDKGVDLIPNEKIRIYNNSLLPATTKFSGLASDSKNLYATLPESRLLIIDSFLKATIKEPVIKSPSPILSLSFKTDGTLLTNQDTSFTKSLESDYITNIIQVTPRQYLVGGVEGLRYFDNKILKFNSKDIGFTYRVTSICKQSMQKYLIGTLKGLYYFTPYGYKITQEPYLQDIRVSSIKTLNPKIYAVATRGEGVAINIENKFYTIGQTRGIISNLVEDLYFETDSILWIATFKGISKVYFHINADSLVTRVKNYTREDGLCSNQVNGITGFKGLIWLATTEGLCYFPPQDLSESITSLPLYFGTISINGERRSKDSLMLKHDENNILIEFNALYYKAIQGIRYKVRLRDVGPWKFIDLNYVQYFSLPPGEYVFEVAAEDANGKYISQIHTLHFTIKPRFVDTALFKFMIVIIALLIATLIFYAVFSYQKLKSTNIIKLLQSEFKALSYQINPHFIFNVLNSIQYYILKKDTNNAVHLLGSFSLLIRRIVNNSRQQYIGIIEEVECLKEYMDLEKMRLDNKFEYTINIDSSIDVEDRNILPMIIQPMVENSIWHGIVPSHKRGVISINFKKENGAVICTVDDNGIGIHTALTKEKSQNNLSLAMKNVSERLKIISELNDSTWAIRTEDKSAADSSQSGTIVTIIFPALKDKK